MEIALIIIGMALVTYIPRLLPVFVGGSMPPWVERWLKCVPYAALAALIFPGILSIDERPIVGLGSAVVCIVLAYFRVHILLIMIFAIATSFLLSI
ncbi:AzlD domain-containing protein [Priestia megaterium]|nr:AzlD domain-containing protein [Priestia megaterium]